MQSSRSIKPICFYLPQYYTFKENDEWWGEGFTEWTNVKRAKSLFSWHVQPRVPYGNNYYELNHHNHETMSRQIDIAKEYGVYGFCFYHYWFKNGRKLLEIPVEKFLEDKSLNINFCLSWANEPWTRAWDGGNKQIIMPQEYGEEKEWKEHFFYLLPFLKDERYIRVNDKPILIIYRPELIERLEEMLQLWADLAVCNGLPGIEFISQGTVYGTTKHRSPLISKYILYEPGYTQGSFSLRRSNQIKMFRTDPRLYMNVLMEKVKISIGAAFGIKNPWWTTTILDFDLLWNRILSRNISDADIIPGAFTAWDNSPRRGAKGARIIRGASPEKFQENMTALFKKTLSESNQDMVFITAWNEWAEGAYLEPDEQNGYGYLKALKEALTVTGE